MHAIEYCYSHQAKPLCLNIGFVWVPAQSRYYKVKNGSLNVMVNNSSGYKDYELIGDFS